MVNTRLKNYHRKLETFFFFIPRKTRLISIIHWWVLSNEWYRWECVGRRCFSYQIYRLPSFRDPKTAVYSICVRTNFNTFFFFKFQQKFQHLHWINVTWEVILALFYWLGIRKFWYETRSMYYATKFTLVSTLKFLVI